MLFVNKENCCGCSACEYTCPKKAITMKEDKYGYKYPSVDESKCISCGLCEKVCAFNNNENIERHKTRLCYAAANLNLEQKKYSASGGVFSALAKAFIEKNGLVCGVEMKFLNGKAIVKHTIINSFDKIHELQGSKYVQSDLVCLHEIESALKLGRKVLFSGTPCQVAQVRKMFAKYEENLYTIDIICHGVPNQRWFNDYLNILSGKNKVVECSFRNKDAGWGHNSLFYTLEIKNQKKQFSIDAQQSSYYKYFLDCESFRSSCYCCPYACENRVGDLTIGDCWGIEVFAPELLDVNGGCFNQKEGISCVLVNDIRGEKLLNLLGTFIEKKTIKVEDLEKINHQLKKPAAPTKQRKRILYVYYKYGYRGLEIYFRVVSRLKKAKYEVWKLIHAK